MKSSSLTWCSAVLLVAAFAVAVGCGDSKKNDGDDSSSGGEATTGGAAPTGGGGSAGRGGSGGSSGGATPTGGGGSAGASGAGGTSGGATPSGGGSAGASGAGGTSGAAGDGPGGAGAGGVGNGGAGGTGDHRELTLTVSTSFGFDDFGSPGAALGVAVDESAGFVLVVALKFQLPFYTGSFTSGSDAGATAAAYRVSPPVAPLVDEAAAYPLITAALTDTAGVRTILGSVSAVLLEGDPEQATPERIYVADGGTVTLLRNDDPADVLEGELSFTEVTALGSGATVAANATTVDLAAFYFEWNTSQQP